MKHGSETYNDRQDIQIGITADITSRLDKVLMGYPIISRYNRNTLKHNDL